MNHYQALGIDASADAAAIKQAWRVAAKRWHSDSKIEPDVQRFIAAREAFDVLSDPAKRAAYDQRHKPTAPPVAPHDSVTFRRTTAGWVTEPADVPEDAADLHLPFGVAAAGGVVHIELKIRGRPIAVTLTIQPGTKVGATWLLRGRGMPTVVQGRTVLSDLRITLRRIEPSDAWQTRPNPNHRGVDFHGRVKVSLELLLLGGEAMVEAPRGALAVKVPARSIAPLRVVGQGVDGGDLVVELDIEWPAATPQLLQELRRQTNMGASRWTF